MNSFMETLTRLNRLQKLGGAVVIYLIVGGAMLGGIYTSVTNRTQAIIAENDSLTEEKEEYRSRAENKTRFEREVDQLNEDFSQALQELPDSSEINELLRRISTIGKKIGLEFLLFQPMPEVQQGFYAEVPVRIEVEGSYHEVAMFFDRVGKLNRIVNIRDITMSEPEVRAGKVILRTTGLAVTYRFLSAEEQQAAQAPRRRRG